MSAYIKAVVIVSVYPKLRRWNESNHMKLNDLGWFETASIEKQSSILTDWQYEQTFMIKISSKYFFLIG